MSLRVDVVSIGALGRNLIWNESGPRRTQHATTTLIRTARKLILVDPGLPGQALQARLSERTGLESAKITDVFLTHLDTATIAGLVLFPTARLLAHQPDIAALERTEFDDPQQDQLRRQLLKRLAPAPDKLAPQVDLFPLPGYSAGTAGLLVSAPLSTTLIAGPAVASLDHFLAGQVLPDCCDVRSAKESLREVYEIADVIVPGFDNWFQNPRALGT